MGMDADLDWGIWRIHAIITNDGGRQMSLHTAQLPGSKECNHLSTKPYIHNRRLFKTFYLHMYADKGKSRSNESYVYFPSVTIYASMYIPDIVVTEVEPMLLDANDKRVGPRKPEITVHVIYIY